MQTFAPPQVETPLPKFEPTQATRGSRLQAAIIDGLLVVAIYFVGLLANMPELIIVGIIGLVIYQMYLLAKDGQTIGKRFSNIRIVMVADNSNGGFMPNVGMRLVLNGIIALVPFYALVDILFIFREDQRCIHDMIAGTKVIEA